METYICMYVHVSICLIGQLRYSFVYVESSKAVAIAKTLKEDLSLNFSELRSKYFPIWKIFGQPNLRTFLPRFQSGALDLAVSLPLPVTTLALNHDC